MQQLYEKEPPISIKQLSLSLSSRTSNHIIKFLEHWSISRTAASIPHLHEQCYSKLCWAMQKVQGSDCLIIIVAEVFFVLLRLA